jgi:thiol-disulfide isomerase/thioredoxin
MTRLLPIVFIFSLCSSYRSREPVLSPLESLASTPRISPWAPRVATPPTAHPATPPTAVEIIKQACAEAAASNKKVMVLFQASWCGWCHKLDTLMASPACKPLFDQSFVVCHLTIAESPDKHNLENPGAEELYDKYANKDSGIPFFLILAADGAVIADSRMKPAGAKPGSSGDNIGYPASKEEVAYFLRVLHETTLLTGNQLKIIKEKLSKS